MYLRSHSNTHIINLAYRICILATNIMILNEYRTIRMVCFSPNFYAVSSIQRGSIVEHVSWKISTIYSLFMLHVRVEE